MNKLWVRLSLAFALVLLIGLAITAILADRQVNAEFQRYVARSQLDNVLWEEIAALYALQGNWQGIEQVFVSHNTVGRGQRRGAPKHILADATGLILYDETGMHASGDRMSSEERQRALPIQVEDETIGYLYTTTGGQGNLLAAEQAFLTQVNRALLQAGAVAGVLGIVLGLLLARSIAAPLGRLASAAHRLAEGKLDERVRVQGTAEMIEAAQAFNDMATSLEQAEILRRNLVADIAHELRTPLTVVQGNLQAILDDVYPLEKGEIATVYDETLVLARLVSDLRDLSQAEAGQLHLNVQPVEVQPVLDSVNNAFAEYARQQDIHLHSTNADAIPHVLADPDRLRQILNNLLGNALRHTPQGGSVRIEAEKQGIAQNDGRVRFSVVDMGSGIPSQDLPQVFARFWRAERSRSRKHGGSGLGLAISRQLVEAQGGEIGVESEVGRGSVFWFTLPVAGS
jgi:two-component system OmpR family sensor kinase/two-component system sensor histidine kinase BaeS